MNNKSVFDGTQFVIYENTLDYEYVRCYNQDLSQLVDSSQNTSFNTTELTHSLPDTSFSASSHNNSICQPWNVKLSSGNQNAWCPLTTSDPNDYLQIEFDQLKTIEYIITMEETMF